MGQVPKYLIAGYGRVARHFLHYFSRLNIPVAHWQRGMGVVPDADRILVLISDSAIENFVDEHLADTKGVKIHFSGALVTDKAYGAHPLMTFNTRLYDLDTYKKIPFVIDADAPSFEDLLPGLTNPHARLDKDMKAKYHAMCCMAANYSCLLWQKLFTTFQNEFNLPPQMANMLLTQQTQNLVDDYITALTGPLSRGDQGTLDKHLKSLAGDEFLQVYEAFMKAYNESKQ